MFWQHGMTKKSRSKCSVEQQTSGKKVWTTKNKSTTTVQRFRNRTITQIIKPKLHTLTPGPYVTWALSIWPISLMPVPISIPTVQPQRPSFIPLSRQAPSHFKVLVQFLQLEHHCTSSLHDWLPLMHYIGFCLNISTLSYYFLRSLLSITGHFV